MYWDPLPYYCKAYSATKILFIEECQIEINSMCVCVCVCDGTYCMAGATATAGTAMAVPPFGKTYASIYLSCMVWIATMLLNCAKLKKDTCLVHPDMHSLWSSIWVRIGFCVQFLQRRPLQTTASGSASLLKAFVDTSMKDMELTIHNVKLLSEMSPPQRVAY